MKRIRSKHVVAVALLIGRYESLVIDFVGNRVLLTRTTLMSTDIDDIHAVDLSYMDDDLAISSLDGFLFE